MKTTQHQDLDRSQLFLVRLWMDHGRGESGNSSNSNVSANPNTEKEWHGRVQHIVSGEAYSFHDWPTLVNLLLEMLSPHRGEYPEGSDR